MRKLLAVALLTVYPASASAQLPTAGEAMNKVDAATNAAPVTEYDFEPDEVNGEPNKPLDETIVGEDRRRTSTLILVRQNFVPEMMKSVEDL